MIFFFGRGQIETDRIAALSELGLRKSVVVLLLAPLLALVPAVLLLWRAR